MLYQIWKVYEVLKSFKENNLSFFNSFPSCEFFNDEESQSISHLFKKGEEGSKIERFFSQLSMIFNKQGAEGGLFIFLGKKN